MTVPKNPIPRANATNLNRFFSITMFLVYSVADETSSEVIKRIIAMAASHKLMSEIDKGNFNFQPSSSKLYQNSIVSPLVDILSCWIVTIFPVVLAIAHAIALVKGSPRR